VLVYGKSFPTHVTGPWAKEGGFGRGAGSRSGGAGSLLLGGRGDDGIVVINSSFIGRGGSGGNENTSRLIDDAELSLLDNVELDVLPTLASSSTTTTATTSTTTTSSISESASAAMRHGGRGAVGGNGGKGTFINSSAVADDEEEAIEDEEAERKVFLVSKNNNSGGGGGDDGVGTGSGRRGSGSSSSSAGSLATGTVGGGSSVAAATIVESTLFDDVVICSTVFLTVTLWVAFDAVEHVFGNLGIVGTYIHLVCLHCCTPLISFPLLFSSSPSPHPCAF